LVGFIQRRDIDVLLFEMLNVNFLLETPHFAPHDRESVGAMLDSAQSVAQRNFHPIAAALDANGPRFVGGRVEMMDAASGPA
jgi:hypothetical protein